MNCLHTHSHYTLFRSQSGRYFTMYYFVTLSLCYFVTRCHHSPFGSQSGSILQFVTSSLAQKVPLPGTLPVLPVLPCQALSSNTKPYQAMNRRPYHITQPALTNHLTFPNHAIFYTTHFLYRVNMGFHCRMSFVK